MYRTNLAFSLQPRTASDPHTRSLHAGRLSCIWVPTGNPRQPLARVWMSRDAADDEPPLAGRKSRHAGLFLVRA